MMNLRQFLKIYHMGPQELPHLESEIEVLSFEEVVDFVKQQNMFSAADLQRIVPFSSKPYEEALEKLFSEIQCVFEVPKNKAKIVDMAKFV